MVTSTIGRRIRLGLIGGGPGSIIGETHRIAARLDGQYDIVAAALSSNPERARRAARDLGIGAERAYASWQQMLEAEAARPDRIDAVAVMTPNDSHHPICMLALERGFHVICDKPLASDLAQAREIAARVKTTNAEFCVTYCYTGFPMVRQARDMVLAGELGEIRQVHLQYVQSYLAGHDLPAGWRTEGRAGSSLVLMDIGTHAFHLGAFVTGLDVTRLCADVGSAIPGRTIDDYVSALLRYENGARGSLWVTNAAAGSEHGLSFRIHGDKGGLEWHQEEPNRLIHRRQDAFEEIITRRLGPATSAGAQRSTRIAIGHPEGYLEAFANLYTEFAQRVATRIAGAPGDDQPILFPGVSDGVKGLAFVAASVKSMTTGGWQEVERM
ncbi:Gfo/Idh/MocA family oxidoreductase [Paraburkholderia caribensis]|uniref:Oxidoreductase n=1 Tax=Paraburkholderia caribensis TaxID=75105 RepID=A0A9Q6WLH3_9BURK|nr:Gfo/Idh/MocA family oxidoreductase [Paraburkholderia caribensis]MCO4876022.1 Gfo/Idh/MocA family oxidoreductase [Paraburkholderia caribensis]PTB25631.1 oxidoreductase [Paraburkholderia caribensis]QLB62704.1 oxidoreductase [Paraburkholderia caribensis]